jgi:hypothetical protein
MLFAWCINASGQEVTRWELGPTVSLIKIREFDSNRFFGIGARGVLNFSRVLGTDVQFARVAAKEFFAPSNSRTEYSHDQFTANLKASWRTRNALRVSPFAIAGMGLARDGVTSSFQGPFPGSFKIYQNKLALRFGGGLELVAYKQFSIRLDVSDLASRIPAASSTSGEIPARWWNRLDGSIAMMVRLGSMH